MLINKEQLKKAMPLISDQNIGKYLPVLQIVVPNYGINTPLRMAHFLAQIGHENLNFTQCRENLNYSAEGLLKNFKKYFNPRQAREYEHQPIRIASRVYANRYGNGDEASMDGWKFRGRGAIMCTFFDNYRECSLFLFGDSRLISCPELLELPENGIKAACWFWTKHNLNYYADKDNANKISITVNGGTNGLDDRLNRLTLAKKALCVN